MKTGAFRLGLVSQVFSMYGCIGEGGCRDFGKVVLERGLFKEKQRRKFKKGMATYMYGSLQGAESRMAARTQGSFQVRCGMHCLLQVWG